MDGFGDTLRQHRKAAGWSLRKFAELTAYDFGYLGQIERGNQRSGGGRLRPRVVGWWCIGDGVRDQAGRRQGRAQTVGTPGNGRARRGARGGSAREMGGPAAGAQRRGRCRLR
ncbi:helix-turn-helix domain-containing protein [Micromonospora trifolii]|uniref:helix-turn-helix domain-containing protein n=1 Tax=Micromonospora trifolii TaxID=2911208 RepID=UPI003D2EB9FD